MAGISEGVGIPNGWGSDEPCEGDHPRDPEHARGDECAEQPQNQGIYCQHRPESAERDWGNPGICKAADAGKRYPPSFWEEGYCGRRGVHRSSGGSGVSAAGRPGGLRAGERTPCERRRKADKRDREGEGHAVQWEVPE